MMSKNWHMDMLDLIAISCMIWRLSDHIYVSSAEPASNSKRLKEATATQEIYQHSVASLTEQDRTLAQTLKTDLTLSLSMKKLAQKLSTYEQDVLTMLDSDTWPARGHLGQIARLPEMHIQTLQQEALCDLLKNSVYLGDVTDKTKREFNLTLIQKKTFNTANNFYARFSNADTMIYICRDQQNNLVKFFNKPLESPVTGDTFTVRARVKKHAWDQSFNCASTLINYVKFPVPADK